MSRYEWSDEKVNELMDQGEALDEPFHGEDERERAASLVGRDRDN